MKESSLSLAGRYEEMAVSETRWNYWCPTRGWWGDDSRKVDYLPPKKKIVV